jgi:O-antigen/teichoic acid export membrane protein
LTSEAKRAARNAGAIAAASILSKGTLFAWQLFLARMIGESDYGVYGTVGAFIAIAASIVSFGMGPIVIRDVARHPEKAAKYLTSTLVIQSALSALAYIILIISAGVGGYSEVVRFFVAVAGVNLLIDILGNMCNDLLLAQERMAASSLITILHIFGLVILAALALLLNGGLLGVYIATIVAGFGRALALWLLVIRGGVRPEWPLDKAVAWPLLLNGAPLAFSAFLSLAYQHADKLLTARFIGRAETGYLTAAFVMIFGVIELLSTTVLTATYPMMSRYQSERGEMFRFIVEKLAFFTLVISLPISLVLSIFAADVIVPLFGDDFRPTADVLRVLIWYALVTMTANVFAQAMMTQNRQRRLLVIRAVGLAVNILLLLILLPTLRVQGAAVASLAAELLVLSILVSNFRSESWEWGRILPRLLRLTGVGLAVAVVMIALRGVHPLLGMVGGLSLYAGLVFFSGVLADDDWDLLYRLTAAMPGGAVILRYWRRDVVLS